MHRELIPVFVVLAYTSLTLTAYGSEIGSTRGTGNRFVIQSGPQAEQAKRVPLALSQATPTSNPRSSTSPKATPTFRPNEARLTPNPNQQNNTLKPQPASAHVPSSTKPMQKQSAPTSPKNPTGLVQMMSEGFEGIWPEGAWSVSGYPTWDDTSYLAHSGYWSAWCAAYGLDPWIDNYANNMDVWTYYGPFDLSDATSANLQFYYWNQSEQNYDFFQWFASVDGSNYYGYQVSGDSGGWNYIDFDLTNVPTLGNVTGRSSVWIAFRFVSDISITYKGAFIDDISLSKYVPGQVTAQGTFLYYDRDGATLRPARYMTVYLYDSNPGSVDEWLDITTTDSNGYFHFSPVINWESDGTPRDLYVVWETSYNDPGNTYANPTRRVTDFGNNAYRYYSYVCTDCQAGTVDFSSYLPTNFPNLEASWIFQDLRQGWEYMMGQTGTDPGSSIVKWQTQQTCYNGICSSYFNAALAPYIFISYDSEISSDTVIHELGHNYMYNATGYWYWSPTCSGHDIFLGKESSCGWSEGWADFFALTVDAHKVGNAVCYDKGIGPCSGTQNVSYFDLENQGWTDGQPQGDTVEGRVAGALYDLFDYMNDGYDQIGFSFAPQIWNIAGTAPSTFLGFWNNWKARGYEKHSSVQSIYQNTIDYDLFPSFNNLPTLTLLQGITYNHAVDLWSYASDPESANWQMTYAFVGSTDARCGASVDSHYVNFALQSGWVGSCNVTVSVYDGIKGANGTFTVNVVQVPVGARNYLPFIAK